MGNTFTFTDNTTHVYREPNSSLQCAVVSSASASASEPTPTHCDTLPKFKSFDHDSVTIRSLPNNDIANMLRYEGFMKNLCGANPDFDIDGTEILRTLKVCGNSVKSCEQFTISNDLSQSSRWMPYWEILYPDYSTQTYYDYVSTENSIQTTVGSDLYLEEEGEIVLNDKRLYMADMSIIFHEDEENSEQFPQYKYLQYRNPNYVPYSVSTTDSKTLDLYVQLKKMTTLSMLQSNELYTEKQVDRTSAFIFYPKTTVYILINTIDKKIYCMQTMTNQTKEGTTINETNLIYLKHKLNLPNGWMYSLCMMDKDTYLILVSDKNHRAKVINDDFNNSYQYIRPEEAPFLYKGI